MADYSIEVAVPNIGPQGPPGPPASVDFSSRNILYVSKGSAATNTRGALSKYDSNVPFATITAAQSAASAGDVIFIESGTYSETDLGKNGISYWFAPNCTVGGSATTSNNAIFTDNNSGVSFSIYGYPKILDRGEGGGRGVGMLIQNADSKVYAELQSVEVAGGDILVGLYLEAGSGTIIVRESVISDGYDALLVAGGNWTVCAESFEAPSIIADGGNAVEITGGQSRVFASKGLFTRGAASEGGSTGSSSAIVVLGGSSFVQAPLIKSDADTTVSVQGGSLKIVGAKIEAASTFSALAVSSATTATIDACELVSGSSATNGITGSGTVFASTLRTNKPVAGGVTLNLSLPIAAAVADATDAASTQARLNDLLSRLRSLKLIAT
jgi:hypothetical protein